MIELSFGVETGMVAAGVAAMLGMGTWLFFRNDSNGEKSLFLKMLSPGDDEMETCKRVPLFLSSVSLKGGSSNGLKTGYEQGIEALNQSMRLVPRAQSKKDVADPHTHPIPTGRGKEFRTR